MPHSRSAVRRFCLAPSTCGQSCTKRRSTVRSFRSPSPDSTAPAVARALPDDHGVALDECDGERAKQVELETLPVAIDRRKTPDGVRFPRESDAVRVHAHLPDIPLEADLDHALDVRMDRGVAAGQLYHVRVALARCEQPVQSFREPSCTSSVPATAPRMFCPRARPGLGAPRPWPVRASDRSGRR